MGFAKGARIAGNDAFGGAGVEPSKNVPPLVEVGIYEIFACRVHGPACLISSIEISGLKKVLSPPNKELRILPDPLDLKGGEAFLDGEDKLSKTQFVQADVFRCRTFLYGAGKKECGWEMAKFAKPIKRPTCKSGFSGKRKAVPHVMVNRKRRDSWAPVAMPLPVKFMELRPSMCRWPIGDPQHSETFRFCGSACPSEASYCKTHNTIAHASSRPGTPRKTKFQMRPGVRVA